MLKRGLFRGRKLCILFSILSIFSSIILSINMVSAQNSPQNSLISFNKLIIVIGGGIVAFLVSFIISKTIRKKKTKNLLVKYDILKNNKTKSQTDLDLLYELIKEKKQVELTPVSIAFNISKEKAFSWAKILEDNELITINYPPFGDQTLVLKGYEAQNKNPKINPVANIKNKEEIIKNIPENKEVKNQDNQEKTLSNNKEKIIPENKGVKKEIKKITYKNKLKKQTKKAKK